MSSIPLRKCTAVSLCKISLNISVYKQFPLGYCLKLVVMRDYFYHLQRHHRAVNDLPTAVKLTNHLLRFWADRLLVYYKRVCNASYFVWSHITLCHNVVVCNHTSLDKN